MKTCFITGANAGIGKAAAIQIAAKGYRVLLGARNGERGLKAMEEIKKASGSDAIQLLLIDLASKESVSKAANTIKQEYKSLDVLIHNAADFDISRKKPEFSPEGIETVWATNHIGPVLLTSLLSDELKNADQARILTVSSKGLLMHPKLNVNLEDPEFKTASFSVAKAYYQSKLAQLMYTYWLAEKYKDDGITANCIRVTNVKIDIDRYPGLSGFSKFLYSLKSSMSIAPEKMAETYTRLATDPDLFRVSGKYFNEKMKIVSSTDYSRNKIEIEKLMKLTEKYL